MYPLFETVCLSDGEIKNFEYHQHRYSVSYYKYYGKRSVDNIIQGITIADEYNCGLYKVKISYNDTSRKIEFEKYRIRDINSLAIIEENTIEYGLKFTNRDNINRLYNMRGDCDDILILKNGEITDTSICNIVFFDGQKWITPENPLLEGTARAKLLKNNKVDKYIIKVGDLGNLKSFKLINSMRDFDKMPEINICNIKY